MISIILTCYKQEKFIEETIQSVVSQSFSNWELLIGDDSPNDETWDIIMKYVDKYPNKIKARHHSPNKGLVENMLFLIDQRNKKSDYIVFLEGDDYLLPEYLNKKLNIFNKYPNKKLIYNELTTINSKGDIINERHLKKYAKGFCNKGNIAYEKLLSEVIYVSRSTLMIRSDILDKYQICPPFSGNRTIISDIFFFNQIAHNEDIFGIEEPLVCYRIHENNTSRNILNSINFHLDLIKYLDYLNNKGLINQNFYTIQSCRWFLVIGILGTKKAFSFGLGKTFKVFFGELFNSIRRRFDGSA